MTKDDLENNLRKVSNEVLTKAYGIACMLKVHADNKQITGYEEIGKRYKETAKGKGLSHHLGVIFTVCELHEAQSLTILVKTANGVSTGYDEQRRNISSRYSEQDELKATMKCFKDNKDNKYQHVLEWLEKEIETRLNKKN